MASVRFRVCRLWMIIFLSGTMTGKVKEDKSEEMRHTGAPYLSGAQSDTVHVDQSDLPILGARGVCSIGCHGTW